MYICFLKTLFLGTRDLTPAICLIQTNDCLGKRLYLEMSKALKCCDGGCRLPMYKETLDCCKGNDHKVL